MKNLFVEFLGFVILSGIFWGMVAGDEAHYYDFVLGRPILQGCAAQKARWW
ncbi:hypothetical protein CsSME_00014428 [Camellia sinensis var. sinensis]